MVAEEGIAFTSTVVGESRDLPPKIENNLLRIGQEAVNNAVRHARAENISVRLVFDATSVRLNIKDDGRGFDPEAKGVGSNGHFGLVGMRERAREMGGEVRVGHTDNVIRGQVGGGTLRIRAARFRSVILPPKWEILIHSMTDRKLYRSLCDTAAPGCSCRQRA